MDTFPKTNEAWTAVHDDRAPVVQGGVCSQINGEKFVHWYGRLSELAEGGRAIKFPKGYVPERYVVEANPIEDPVGRYGLGVELAEDASVALVATACKRNPDTKELGNGDGESGAAFEGVTIAGPSDGSDSDSDADAGSATYGVVATGAVASGAVVTDDAEYVKLVATSSGTTLDRAANDCFVEVRFIIRQVYPDDAIGFHH